ncbi:unnamed protein product [Spirodela intermedia]|uniref:Nodulin-like domain-containing protein n=1 Tax=Spirodela intermedia TaxID=51605 RepID=A0A7I8JLL9_SPIIN|nr:unnamed protein product [Spirodela intermedia]CAA6670453.1 unnamed protein product [Spirodela intermedia]
MPAMAVKNGSRPPWVGLGAAVWVQMAAGCGYTFPLYSPALKSALGLTQQQLTILGVANDVGENIGVLPGVLCNRIPPWGILLVGAACSFAGFGALWLAVSRTVTSIPYWLQRLAGHWRGGDQHEELPSQQGTVAGLLKGYAGLSAAVYTGIYAGILHNSSTSILLLLTLGIPLVSILLMSFVRPCTPASGDNTTEGGHFLFVQASSVYCWPLSGDHRFEEVLLSKSSSSVILRSSQELDDASEMGILLAEGEGAVKMKRRPRRGDDFRFREALSRLTSGFCSWCTSWGRLRVTVLNNLAQIATASYVEDTTILLTLFSFCNFIGRLGGGVISEHLSDPEHFPDNHMDSFTQLTMVFIFLLFASAINGPSMRLLPCLASATVSKSVSCTLVSSTISCPWGTPWGPSCSPGFWQGLCMMKAARQHQGDVGPTVASCVGPECFRLTFLFLAAFCGVGFLLSLVLTLRVRPVYQMLYSGGSFSTGRSSGH